MLKYMRIDPVRVLLILAIGLPACKTVPRPADARRALGSYEGSMGKGILAITINYINGTIVSGFDVHRGTRRNLNGTLRQDGATLSFDLREPGDRKGDGKYSFTVDTAQWNLKGTFKPLHDGSEGAMDFSLHRLDSAEETDYVATWYVSDDSLLVLKPAGYCEFQYYIHSADSTSQLNTVRGSYSVSGNTYRIEWEKNTATPALRMTLHLKVVPYDNEGDSTKILEGDGWEIHERMAG